MHYLLGGAQYYCIINALSRRVSLQQQWCGYFRCALKQYTAMRDISALSWRRKAVQVVQYTLQLQQLSRGRQIVHCGQILQAVYLYLYCSVALQCTCSVAVQLHHQLSRWGIVVDCRLLQCSCSVVLWLCSASCSWAGGEALVHCRGLEINQPPTPGRERTTLQTQRPASPPPRLFFGTLQKYLMS